MIPEGYQNGNGKVTQSVKTEGAQTFTPGRSNQVIGANQWLSGAPRQSWETLTLCPEIFATA